MRSVTPPHFREYPGVGSIPFPVRFEFSNASKLIPLTGTSYHSKPASAESVVNHLQVNTMVNNGGAGIGVVEFVLLVRYVFLGGAECSTGKQHIVECSSGGAREGVLLLPMYCSGVI